MTDLMYFGYEWDSDSKMYEQEFIQTVKRAFHDVKLTDAYDSIKGYRHEVDIPDEQSDSYLAWLVGNGWYGMSLTLQLMDIDRLKEIFATAKAIYPKAFKTAP